YLIDYHCITFSLYNYSKTAFFYGIKIIKYKLRIFMEHEILFVISVFYIYQFRITEIVEINTTPILRYLRKIFSILSYIEFFNCNWRYTTFTKPMNYSLMNIGYVMEYRSYVRFRFWSIFSFVKYSTMPRAVVTSEPTFFNIYR